MKKQDVVIGQVYIVKVSRRLTRVRLESVCQFGGWNGTNISTGRAVRIRSAARLRDIAPAVDSSFDPVADLNEARRLHACRKAAKARKQLRDGNIDEAFDTAMDAAIVEDKIAATDAKKE